MNFFGILTIALLSFIAGLAFCAKLTEFIVAKVFENLEEGDK